METKETYEARIDELLKEWKTQLHLFDAKATRPKISGREGPHGKAE